MISYCRRCVLPATRPNLILDAEGVCNACRAHAEKTRIDWPAREGAFREVVRNARAASHGYDCVIPVSGGKDSTWQVVTCLEYGLHPLAVTWKTPARTKIGQENLDNLVSLGVDHVDYQVNPKAERIFLARSFERFGSTAIPMHMALFSIPLRIALRFKIPLVVWGENSAFEYGGEDDVRRGFRLDARWLAFHGLTHGTTAADWVSEDLSAADLTPYYGPREEELERAAILAVFLGYYFIWDPETSLSVARAHGFRVRTEGPRTGLWNYADIDDDFISIHHWLKWYKFGFTRLFDNISVEIRNGRMTRAEAIETIRATGEQRPDADIDRLCAFLGKPRAWFFDTAERFRNHRVWTRRGDRWIIEGFLIPEWFA